MAKKATTTGFSQRLRTLREGAGLSQQDLADRAGLNRFAVAKLEQGIREPAWETALALARALDVPLTSFVEADVAAQDVPVWDRIRALQRALAAALAEAERQGTPSPPEPSGRKKDQRKKAT